MGKLLGVVNIYDNTSLNTIIHKHNLGYINKGSVWNEAQDYFDANASEDVEVRLRGLDHIIVCK